MSPTPDARQLFRFSVISQVLARIAQGQQRSDAVPEVAAASHVDGGGRVKRVSARSVYRWLAQYEARGVDGLADPPRQRAAEAIPETLLTFLLLEHRRDAEASIPELLRRAHLRGVVSAEAAPHRSTVHRALLRHGVCMRRAKKRRGRDSRRFAYPHRMDMVLCDGKHFRAGAHRLRRVAMSFLDDASRKVLHVVVGTSESAELFLRGLYECILMHGFMTVLYLDHGPGYIADATRIVAANLGVHLVLGEVAYPQGHGKVERYHRTLEADLLRHLDRRPDVDPAVSALELRLRHYVHDVYAYKPHEGLFGETPQRRFFELDDKPLRVVSQEAEIETAFELEHERLVSHDHVVSLDGVLFEMPRGTASKKVTLRQRVLDRVVFVEHEGRRLRLQPLDPEKNARAPRARPEDVSPDPSHPTGTSAAELRFQEEFPPVVDPDGGCPPSRNDPLDFPEQGPT